MKRKKVNPIFNTDAIKTAHTKMYPPSGTDFSQMTVVCGAGSFEIGPRALRQMAERRLSVPVTKSNLTYNDLVFLATAGKAVLRTLVAVAKENKKPEHWSEIELLRTTPSWTRVAKQLEEQVRIKALRLAIRRAERTLENA